MRTAIILICIARLCCGRAVAQQMEQHDIRPFKELILSGSVDVYYTQSDSFSLKIESLSGRRQEIEILQDGDNLVIRSKSGSGNARVQLTGHDLAMLHVSGASSFHSNGNLLADKLTVDVSGASAVLIKLQANAIYAVTSGASRLGLEGTTKQLTAQASGASSLRAYTLISEETNAIASGASSMQAYADRRMTANASGASSIKFKGNPKEVNAEASTSSSITRILDNGGSAQAQNRTRYNSADSATVMTYHGNGNADTTVYNTGRRKIIIIERNDSISKKRSYFYRNRNYRHWTGFTVGFNGYLTPSGSTNLPKAQEYMRLDYSKCFNLQLNLFQHNFHIYKNYLNLVTGLGFEWTQYEFSNATKLNADSNYTSGIIDTSNTRSYHKNRLKASFINIPLLLEYNTNNRNPRRSFHIAAGVIAGYKLSSKTKQTYDIDGYNSKTVRKDDYNMNPFRINAHASFGYSNWTLFGDYALSQLFESGRGPQLYPFTIGLRIIPF